MSILVVDVLVVNSPFPRSIVSKVSCTLHIFSSIKRLIHSTYISFLL